jgi:Peptidase M15
MKRFLTVALGVALCSLATAANARPNDFPTVHSDAYSYDFGGNDDSRPSARPRGNRQSARRGNRRSTAGRSQRRYGNVQPHRRQASQNNRDTSVGQRGITSYARGGASRTCLTPAARALLGRIEAQFGSVQVISTCRPGARIAGTGRISRHASGNAVDFNAGGRKGAIVRWLIANHRSGGTMTYAGMGHIHVDIGPRFVSLNSGGGRYR